MRLLLYLLLIGVAVLCLAPIALLLSGSVQSATDLYRGAAVVPTAFHWENYQHVWLDSRFYSYFLNSMLYACIVVPSTLLCASMAAFAFARLQFRGKRALLGLVLAILIVPVSASFIPLYAVLVNLHLVNTRVGYILPLISGGLPIAIFILQRFFAAIPRDLVEAATIDGASIFRVFWQVMLPLVGPGLAAVAILTLVATWNEFLLAVVVFRDQALMPVQQGLVQFNSTERPEQQLMLAAAALAILPVLVAYVIAQRAIIAGVMAGAVRG